MESERSATKMSFESQDPECIKVAALLFKGEVYTGNNHIIALDSLKKVHPDWNYQEIKDGFITNRGRFIDRKEASQIAQQAGQLEHLDKDKRREAVESLDSTHIKESKS